MEFAVNLKLSECFLAICPVLGLSNEREVHELVQRFFFNCDFQENTDVTMFRKAYITKTKIIEFLPDSWSEKWGEEIKKIFYKKGSEN